MSGLTTENLSKEKMQQLLAAVGSRPSDDSKQISASEYNWHEPHYFTREQLSKLDDFTQRMCKTLSAKFSTLCPGEFNVEINEASQHFADNLLAEFFSSRQDNYYLAFGNNPDSPCGLIGIPTETAFTWATQLLGDAETQKDKNRDLSQLEESLLFDIACGIVEALCEAQPDIALQPGKALVKRLLPLELQGTEELCKITFTVTKTASDATQAHILIPCEALEPVVGRSAQDTGEMSAEDTSKALLQCLQEVNVCITAQLAVVELPLKELIDLCRDDILVLDKRIDEPIEVVVEGEPLLRGRAARSAGRYAVVIQEDSQCASSPARGRQSPKGAVQSANPNGNT